MTPYSSSMASLNKDEKATQQKLNAYFLKWPLQTLRDSKQHTKQITHRVFTYMNTHNT